MLEKMQTYSSPRSFTGRGSVDLLKKASWSVVMSLPKRTNCLLETRQQRSVGPCKALTGVLPAPHPEAEQLDHSQ